MEHSDNKGRLILVIISGAQCRMARGLLKWSVRDLEKYSGVSSMTIKRIEGSDGIPNCQINTMIALYNAFDTSGKVRFDGTQGVFSV